MTFDWNVSIGDIIAFIALLGSITMFVLTTIKQAKSKNSAKSANDFYDAAKKYYDLMVDFTPKIFNHTNMVSGGYSNEVKKAICDASIVLLSNKIPCFLANKIPYFLFSIFHKDLFSVS